MVLGPPAVPNDAWQMVSVIQAIEIAEEGAMRATTIDVSTNP